MAPDGESSSLSHWSLAPRSSPELLENEALAESGDQEARRLLVVESKHLRPCLTGTLRRGGPADPLADDFSARQLER